MELLCPSVVAKNEEYAVSGIVRQLACNGGITLEQPPTKIVVISPKGDVVTLKPDD